jgi:hypothetical protein
MGVPLFARRRSTRAALRVDGADRVTLGPKQTVEAGTVAGRVRRDESPGSRIAR